MSDCCAGAFAGVRIDAQSSQVRISFTEGGVHGAGVITLWNWTGIRESQSDCGRQRRH